MVDINQELVEALEDALEEIKQEASINFVSGTASLWQCIQSIKTMAIQALANHKAAKVSNSTGLESAPDKAGDAGFTEEELLEIVYKKVHPTNGAIRGTISALKAAGALRLKGK